MEKEALVKMLIDNRNYHYKHMHETNVKFWYAFGGTLTTILVALAFSEKSPAINTLIKHHKYEVYYMLASILIGYIFIIWGLQEHSSIHKKHTRRLEEAIDYILNPANNYTYDDFWQKYGKSNFVLNSKRHQQKKISLFILEPDIRTGLGYHDSKIGIGILIILIAIVWMIVILVRVQVP